MARPRCLSGLIAAILCGTLWATPVLPQQAAPWQDQMSAIGDSIKARDTDRFITLLDSVVPALFEDPTPTLEQKFIIMAGLSLAARKLADPRADFEVNGWLLAYGEAFLGKTHEITVEARDKVVLALLAAGEVDEAAKFAADGPVSPEGHAIGGFALASLLVQQGKFREAVPLLEAELEAHLRRSGAETAEGVMLRQILGHALVEIGDARRASEILRPAVEWVRTRPFDPQLASFIMLDYGRALSGSGQHEDAIAILTAALQDAEKTHGPQDRTSLMLGLALSNAYGEAGDLRTYDMLRLRHANQAGTANLVPIEMAVTLEEQADFLTTFGRDEQAVPVLQELIELVRSTPELDPAIGIRAQIKLGHALLKTDPFGDGYQHLVAALKWSEDALGANHIQTLRAQLALLKAPSRLADVAPEDLRLVRDMIRNGPGATPAERAANLVVLQRVNKAMAQHDRTRHVTDEMIAKVQTIVAAEMALQDDISMNALDARTLLADFLIDAERYAEALSVLDALAADLARSEMFNIPELISITQHKRARALRGLDQNADALAGLEDAVDRDLTLQRWLQSSGNARHRTGPVAPIRPGWMHATTSWQMAATADPDTADQLRRRAFETLQVSSFGPSAHAFALSEARRLKQDPRAAAAIAEWERAADATLAMRGVPDLSDLPPLDAAERQVRAVVPDFFDRLVPDPLPWAGTPDQAGVSDLLDEDEALVLIVPAPFYDDMGEDRWGFVMAATRDALAWARIPLTTENLSVEIAQAHDGLDERIQVRTAQLSRAPVDPDQPIGHGNRVLFDTDAAHALYMAIFGAPEIAALIADKPEWLLAPQGMAMSLPFAALVTEPVVPPTDAEALRATPWLGVQKALTVLPGVSSLRNRQSSNVLPRANGQQLAYVGFGDPAFSDLAQPTLPGTAEASSDRLRALSRLPRLPGTQAEVLQLSRLFGADQSTVFLGPSASERMVSHLFGTEHSDPVGVLHFATHGLLAGEVPGLPEPALALSSPATGMVSQRPDGGLDDGMLTASEIARLHLASDWVILSACDTSGSADARASMEGLSGLVRAFLLAGARALLVSHWRVQDDIAARLTTQSVRGTLNGLSRAEALRQAMAGIAADTSRDHTDLPLSHPTVWAPFFLVGGD